MTQPRESDIDRACRRASADIDREGPDPQGDVRRAFLQVADVQMDFQGQEDDTRYLIIHGAHNAGFRIAVAISSAGSIGWTLV